MKAQTPESVVLAGCLRYLEVRGIYHWRNNTGAVRIGPGRFIRFGKVGSSDIEGVLPGGRFLAVECKAKDGQLSPEQKRFLTEVEELGGVAIMVRGWRELDEALRDAGYAMKDMPLFEESAAPYGGAKQLKPLTWRGRRKDGVSQNRI